MSPLLNLLSLGCRLFLAGLFLYAAHDKVLNPQSFAWDVARYQVLPVVLVNPASVLLAWLEITIGGLLLLGALTRAAAAWAGLLLAMFIGLMVYAGFTGAAFDCGCFPGQEGHTAGFSAALRDLWFLLPALWVLRVPGTWLRLDNLFWGED